MQIDGVPAGHALAGPCGLPHEDVTAACGELKRLYVLPEWQGAGCGGRLLTHALAWLESNHSAIWVGVYSENLGAQRLYGRNGFETAGEYEFKVGSRLDHEFIMKRGPREAAKGLE